MKRITLDGFEALREDAQGGPELALTDVCLECLTGVAAARAAALAAEEEEHSMLAHAMSHPSSRGGFFISNAWLQCVR